MLPFAGPDDTDVAELRRQIGDLRDTLDAIRRGGVDAVIVGEPGAEQVYTLTSADRPYRLILEDMDEGAATVSGRGIILYANACLARMLGSEVADLVGSDAVTVVPRESRAAFAALLELRPGEHARVEMNLTGPGGTVPMLVAASSLDLEGTPLHCFAVTDLTEQKDAERTLEAKVRERTLELRRANDLRDRAHEALRLADEERRRLLDHVLTARENERAQIAVDLHDDPIQALSSIQYRLGVLAVADETGASDRLASIEADLKAVIGRLRTMMFELRPPSLDEHGLAGALWSVANRYFEETGARVDVEDRLSARLDGHVLSSLFRVGQEALHNVRKHAAASTVRVEVDRHRGGTRLRVSDDGVGFDLAGSNGAEDFPHLGLIAMREQAELARGTFEISSAPGEGTTVTAWIPNTQEQTEIEEVAS